MVAASIYNIVVSVSKVRVRVQRVDPIVVIEESVVTIVRELSLASTQEHLIGEAGVSVERAGFGVLRCVAERGESRVSDLAQVLGVDTSTMSRHVKTLERAGFLVRTADPVDRRSSRVALTPSGVDLLGVLRAARHRYFSELLGQWSAQERDALAPLLERLASDVLSKGARV